MEREQDGPTGLGRRSSARDGQRSTLYGHVEVRLEGVAFLDNP
jgi:hypothetical protein